MARKKVADYSNLTTGIKNHLVCICAIGVAVPFLPVPALANTPTALATIKATEQFIHIYDSSTLPITILGSDKDCKPNNLMIPAKGYAVVCEDAKRVFIPARLVDEVEDLGGWSLVSYQVANGMARARFALSDDTSIKRTMIGAIAEAQAECVSGVYLKSALPSFVTKNDLKNIKSYIINTAPSQQVALTVTDREPFRFTVNGTMRAIAFNFGYDSGKLSSCFLDESQEGDSSFSAITGVQKLIQQWLSSEAASDK